MPAIILCVGPTSDLIARGPDLAATAADAIVSWLTEPYIEDKDAL